ncbi:MAG: serine--tRNA ligase [Planctomycetota bacterium]
MLELNFIREHPDIVEAAVRHKHDKADVKAILAADARRRELLQTIEALRGERNRVSEEIGRLKRDGKDAAGPVAAMRGVGDRIQTLEADLARVETDLNTRLAWIPNVPAADVPVGEDSAGNIEVRRWGTRKEFSFKPLPHWDVGGKLGILDCARAGKIAGSGFALFLGAGARLERALYNFMLDLHTGEHGYTEALPPYLANRTSMFGCGQLPKLEADMYHLDSDDYFLIPTAEVPLTNIHRDEILREEDLPRYFAGYTACFRREAGAYGKDTRGLMRVHQFDKVELVKIVAPETSYAELEKLVANAETVLQRLGIEYRVVMLCTGDLSFAAAKCYDIEIWAPGLGRYLEVSSCSNFEAFQARRANIRYRLKKTGKTDFVHTLNGSGVALARLAAAVLETYQNADGSVTVPEALRSYMGGMGKITAPA